MEKGKLISEQDIGDTVVCDMCNADYTDSKETGGILFGSYAVCPKCHPSVMKDIERHNEQGHIRGICPPNISFKNWILKIRNGNNSIKIYEIAKTDEEKSIEKK